MPKLWCAAAALIALCLVPGSALAGVGNLNLEYEETTVPFATTPGLAAVQAADPCTAGSLLGGGAFIEGSEWGEASISSMYPAKTGDAYDSWAASGDYLGSEPGAVLGETEICGDVADLRYPRSLSVRVPHGSYGLGSVRCPGGRKVIGGGASADPQFDSLRLYHSFPLGEGIEEIEKPARKWRIGLDNVGSGSRHARLYAVCAPLKGLSYVSKSFKVAPETRRQAAARCPDDTYVLGGGVAQLSRYRKSMLVKSTVAGPVDAYDRWTATVDNVGGGDYKAWVYAVCHR